MFLIYNFHLSESFAGPSEHEKLIILIENILNIKLAKIHYDFIKIYGKEAFCLASLTGINEINLMRNWKRMNNLYTVFCYEKSFDNLNFQYMKDHFNFHQYFKYSSDIDKNLSFFKKNKTNNSDFLYAIKDVCPFLNNFIEKRR